MEDKNKYLKYYDQVQEATSAGDLISPNVTYIGDDNKVVYGMFENGDEVAIVLDEEGNPVIRKADYLTFTSENSTSIRMQHYGTNKTTTRPNLQVSVNKGAWEDWVGSSINVGPSRTIRVRGINSSRFNDPDGNNYSSFVITSGVSASGSIMSLVDNCGATLSIPGDGYFYRLFKGCTGLISAPTLPATILTPNCYEDMFWGCKGLTTAPTLPATTLKDSCYSGMFYECTGLVSTPQLLSTELADYCYLRMFSGCTGLTTASPLPATIMKPGCYSNMFSGTSILQAPSLPSTILATSCYEGMFSGTNIIEMPELPATILYPGCYMSMFSNCGALRYIKPLISESIPQEGYLQMFSWCKELATAPEIRATAVSTRGCFEMFSGCVNLEESPKLFSTVLSPGCYVNMFYGCTNLKKISCYAETIGVSFTESWVEGVSEEGEFYILDNDDIERIWRNLTEESGASCGIPENFTVKRIRDPKMIDLGLTSGTLWADRNLGAEEEGDYGNFYAWGETIGYESVTDDKKFYWSDYKFGEVSALTKYNATDGKIVLDSADDAVKSEHGRRYRMPTKAELEELISETTQEINSEGVIFRSTSTEARIFIPFAGACFNNSHDSGGQLLILWSSTRHELSAMGAHTLYCESGGVVNVNTSVRCAGLSVRPVYS